MPALRLEAFPIILVVIVSGAVVVHTWTEGAVDIAVLKIVAVVLDAPPEPIVIRGVAVEVITAGEPVEPDLADGAGIVIEVEINAGRTVRFWTPDTETARGEAEIRI